MELSHATEIYKDKYQKDMTIEAYMELLQHGFILLRENASESALELRELRALRIALEYRRHIITLGMKNKDSIMHSYMRSLS